MPKRQNSSLIQLHHQIQRANETYQQSLMCTYVTLRSFVSSVQSRQSNTHNTYPSLQKRQSDIACTGIWELKSQIYLVATKLMKNYRILCTQLKLKLLNIAKIDKRCASYSSNIIFIIIIIKSGAVNMGKDFLFGHSFTFKTKLIKYSLM